MSSGHKRDLTTSANSKTAGAGNIITGDTVIIPPDCEELLLAVTTDDSVSGVVNAILEVSTDGVNWTTARTKTLGSAGVPAQISHGTVTMPSLTQAAATTVCSVSFAGGALGDSPTYIIELKGDAVALGDDAFYLLKNTTTSPAQDAAVSITANFGDAVELQTHTSPFAFTTVGYEHDNVVIKVTESTNELTAEIQVGAAETGIFRRAAAGMTISNYEDPMDGNAVTGAPIVDILPTGGPTGLVPAVTYTLVITENSANAGPETDLAYFKLKYGGRTSTYDAGSSPKTITLDLIPEGQVVELQVVGNKDADGGDTATTNWYFEVAKVFKLDIKCTEDQFDQEATATLSDIDVNAVVTWENTKYWELNADDSTADWRQPRLRLFGKEGTNEIGIPDNEKAFSASFWYKIPLDVASATGASNLYSIKTTTTQFILVGIDSIWKSSTGTARCKFRCKTNAQDFYAVNDGPYFGGYAGTYFYLTPDVWYHMVVTKKADTGTAAITSSHIQFYINGEQFDNDASGTWTEFAYTENDLTTTSIFSNTTPQCVSWDEIAFFNYELSEANVQTLGGGTSGVHGDATDPRELDAGANKCVGYYRFGDPTDEVNHGICLEAQSHSIAWRPNECYFDTGAASDYDNGGDGFDFRKTEDEWTIAFWAKGLWDSNEAAGGSTDNYSYWNFIFSKSAGTNILYNGISCWWYLEKLYLRIGQGYYTKLQLNTADLTIHSDGEWHHYAFTSVPGDAGEEDQGAARHKLYVDGSVVAWETETDSGSWLTDTADYSGAHLRFGSAVSSTYTRGYWGTYKELAIWKKTLTSGNITTLYNSGVPYEAATLTLEADYIKRFYPFGVDLEDDAGNYNATVGDAVGTHATVFGQSTEGLETSISLAESYLGSATDMTKDHTP